MDGPTFQRFVDDGGELSTLVQQPSITSSDDESNDDGNGVDYVDADAAQPALLRLGLRAGTSQSSSNSKRSSSSLLLSPRTIAELGVLEPDAIIRKGSTFATADHCILAAKELSVRLQAPRVTAKRRHASGHNFVKCTCTGFNVELDTACTFSMQANPKPKPDGSGASWVVSEYVGHNCRQASPAASGSNDAQVKHVSAARLACSWLLRDPAAHRRLWRVVGPGYLIHSPFSPPAVPLSQPCLRSEGMARAHTRQAT